MVIEIIECEEFEAIELGIDRLLVEGEIALDHRIVEKGYLNFSLSKGRAVFRADKHVGLIPLNDTVAIRVRPRSAVANLAHMIVKSGQAPFAIPNFSRGYFPNFESGPNVERIYCSPMVTSAERVVGGGMMKSYVSVVNPPPWRGRLMVSDTIKRYRARNIRYKGEFEFNTLSYSGPENLAIKHALKIVRGWLATNDKKNPLIQRADVALAGMQGVPDFEGRLGPLLQDLARSASHLPSQYLYYRDALWTAYLILQGQVPDLQAEGFVTLDSMIVDMSKVFEHYVRRILIDRAAEHGWRIVNGEDVHLPFFTDGGDWHVQPDIVIYEGKTARAVLDAKYKPEIKETDRYEVLSFMDALGVERGGFICPQKTGASSRYLGVTTGGKILSTLRIDLAAADLEAEADRLVGNVVRLIGGDHKYA